jgi:hypothetical protein
MLTRTSAQTQGRGANLAEVVARGAKHLLCSLEDPSLAR